MAKRKTIGDNPLDAVIPQHTELAPQSEVPRPEKVVKERLTVHVPVDLIERVKNAVYWTPGLTLARLAKEAFTRHVEELEQERGCPFPPRKEDLKGGRPMK